MVGGVDRKALADPKTHYGSGKAATRSFFIQRLTAAANILFLLFFLWFVIRLAGADRAGMVAAIRNPLVAIPLALLVVNVPVHMRIGMREIIEDYVHEAKLNRYCLMVNTYFAIVIAATGLGSIAKIFFWG